MDTRRSYRAQGGCPAGTGRAWPRGFTLIELLVVIAIIALLIGILLPSLGKARDTARQLKDATQIRGIVQSMVVWSQTNRDYYPLPSDLDKDDQTVTADKPFHKDNTGNIYSLLVYNGYTPPEMFISPAEVNETIIEDVDYQYRTPEASIVPAKALWDPGFGGVPGEGEGSTAIGHGRRWYGTRGYASYGHLPPFGKRKEHWRGSFESGQPVMANRGPLYGGVAGDWELAPGALGVNSKTLEIHGGKRTWEGNAAFNDGRVVFITRPDPAQAPWTFTASDGGSATFGDNLFVNENDRTGEPDPDNPADVNRNAWLRLYRNVRTGSNGRPLLSAFVD